MEFCSCRQSAFFFSLWRFCVGKHTWRKRRRKMLSFLSSPASPNFPYFSFSHPSLRTIHGTTEEGESCSFHPLLVVSTLTPARFRTLPHTQISLFYIKKYKKYFSFFNLIAIWETYMVCTFSRKIKYCKRPLRAKIQLVLDRGPSVCIQNFLCHPGLSPFENEIEKIELLFRGSNF